jgi:hypothetical protein
MRVRVAERRREDTQNKVVKVREGSLAVLTRKSLRSRWARELALLKVDD